MKSTFKKKEARITDTEELLKLKKYVDDELVTRTILSYTGGDNAGILHPAKLTGLKLHGKNNDMFEKNQIRYAIKSWIFYFNELGKYFEKQGNKERADRHFAQAIAFETFLGEDKDVFDDGWVRS